MNLNGHAAPLSRVIESCARTIESQNAYSSLLLGQQYDRTELGPDGRPVDGWVPSGSRRRNQGEGEAQPVHFTEEQLHEIRGRSRQLCSTNEFAICGTANRQNYVIGKGLAYRAAALPTADASDPDVMKLVSMTQSVIDAFVDSCELPGLERECMGRLDEEGEYLLRLFPQPSGLLAVRQVEPDNVRPRDGWGSNPAFSYGVETAPGDVETAVAYWIDERPHGRSAPVRVPAEEIVHDRLNVKRTSKRGVPTWYAVDGNLRRAEDLLVSMTSMAKTRAKIAAHRKLTGATAATARSLLDALTVASVTDPGTQQSISFEKMRFGSILTTGGNVDYTFPNANVEIDQFVASLQAELRAIACRVQMPEWMLTADASNANMASTLVAEAPSTKSFEAIQHQFKRRFGEKKVSPGRSLVWRQIDFAVRCGILPREVYQFVGVQCEPPSLVVRNRLAEAQTDEIYNRIGVKSLPTIRLQQGLDCEQEDRGFASHPAPAAPAAAPPADPSRQEPAAPGAMQGVREAYNPSQPRDERGEWAGTGESGKVVPLPKVPEKDDARAERARASQKLTDATVQRWTENHNEPALARAIGGESEPDNKAYDVFVAGAGRGKAHGVEMKTMVANDNSKITMHGDAQARKAAWEQANRATFHTVVYDDRAVWNANGPGMHDESKRIVYYRRGAGAFRTGSMHAVADHEELKKLMATPADKLPPAAQPTAKWQKMQAAARTGAFGDGTKKPKMDDVKRALGGEGGED